MVETVACLVVKFGRTADVRQMLPSQLEQALGTVRRSDWSVFEAGIFER
jgi:hypothetical protein